MGIGTSRSTITPYFLSEVRQVLEISLLFSLLFEVNRFLVNGYIRETHPRMTENDIPQILETTVR